MALGDILIYEQTNFEDIDGTSIWAYAPGVLVRDVVKVSAADTVDKADADGNPDEPAIGLVTVMDYPAVGQCLVRSWGVVSGFVGLTSGARYLLSRAAGGIMRSNDTLNPDYPTTGDFKQTIGVARSTTSLFVMVDATTIAL